VVGRKLWVVGEEIEQWATIREELGTTNGSDKRGGRDNQQQ
jgi:hypothetical protein